MGAEVFIITDDIKRARLIRRLQNSPLHDKQGRPLVVSVKRKKRRRSLSQNALMWAWNTILGNELGYDPEEMHDTLKRKLLPPIIVTIGGEDVEISASTSKLDTVGMSDYLDRLQRFASTDLDIVLPSPDDPATWEAWEQYKAAA